MIFMGIDPGENGGLVCLDGDCVTFTTMPKTEREVWDWFRLRGDEFRGQIVATIEKVGGYIGTPHPSSAMFNFGWSYGGLRMAMIGNNIIPEAVAPRTWMAGVGIPHRKRDESKTQFKQRMKDVAERLYPRLKLTLATSDALLIATYCQWKHEGRFE